MCGLAGHIGIKDNRSRFYLTLELAKGIDNRGGHAAGFVAHNRGGLFYGRSGTTWRDAGNQFLQKCAGGSDFSLMHARFATCGKRHDRDHAHPFRVERDGSPVLYGAHNGIVYDAFEHAKARGASIDVDSQEIFELLADRQYQEIENLSGYGVATWVEADELDTIRLCKLSSSGEIVVVKTPAGMVWGSTETIVARALAAAKLDITDIYEIDTGHVYEIRADGIVDSGLTGVEFGSSYKRYSGGYSSGKGFYERFRGSGWGGYSERAEDWEEFYRRDRETREKLGEDTNADPDGSKLREDLRARELAEINSDTPDPNDAETENEYWERLEARGMSDPDQVTISQYCEWVERRQREHDAAKDRVRVEEIEIDPPGELIDLTEDESRDTIPIPGK